MEKKDSKKSPEDTKNYVALGNPLPPEDDPTSTPSDQVLDRRGNPVDMVRCVEQASSLYHILINMVLHRLNDKNQNPISRYLCNCKSCVQLYLPLRYIVMKGILMRNKSAAFKLKKNKILSEVPEKDMLDDDDIPSKYVYLKDLFLKDVAKKDVSLKYLLIKDILIKDVPIDRATETGIPMRYVVLREMLIQDMAAQGKQLEVMPLRHLQEMLSHHFSITTGKGIPEVDEDMSDDDKDTFETDLSEAEAILPKNPDCLFAAIQHETLEAYLCQLWDLSNVKAVVDMMTAAKAIGILKSSIDLSENIRIKEIMFGIIFNMTTDESNMIVITDTLSHTCIEFMQLSDADLLISIIRIMKKCFAVKSLHETWRNLFVMNPFFFTRVCQIFQYCKNVSLILELADLIDTLAREDSAVLDAMYSEELIFSLLETIMEVSECMFCEDEEEVPSSGHQQLRELSSSSTNFQALFHIMHLLTTVDEKHRFMSHAGEPILRLFWDYLYRFRNECTYEWNVVTVPTLTNQQHAIGLASALSVVEYLKGLFEDFHLDERFLTTHLMLMETLPSEKVVDALEPGFTKDVFKTIYGDLKTLIVHSIRHCDLVHKDVSENKSLEFLDSKISAQQCQIIVDVVGLDYLEELGFSKCKRISGMVSDLILIRDMNSD